MLRTPDLKLVDAEKLVRAAEATHLQVKELKGASEAEVNYIKKDGAMQSKKKQEVRRMGNEYNYIERENNYRRSNKESVSKRKRKQILRTNVHCVDE